MKRLVRMFLIVFILFLIGNLNVSSQDTESPGINTDITCGKKRVVVDFLNPSNDQEISKDLVLGNTLSLKEVEPNELSLDVEKEGTLETFIKKENEFLAVYDVTLVTEADCDNITWTLGGQTHSGTLRCGSSLGFQGVPEGIHSMVVSGCGGRWEANLNVTGEGYVVVCPSNLDITDCCSEGVLTGGEYYCDDECSNAVGGSSVYVCTEAKCSSGFEWTFGGQKHTGTLDCDTNLIFENVPQGTYTASTSGCGWTFTWDSVSVDGSSDRYLYMCPDGTDLGCCGSGCGRSGGDYNGSFYCDECVGFRPPPPDCLNRFFFDEHSEEIELLRNFRDQALSQSPIGQEIIRLYYQWSPVIIKAMEEDEELREEVKKIIDGVLPLLEQK